MKKPFVLDCSVTMSWLLPSQSNDYSRMVLEALASEREFAIVPPLWELEVVNVILVQIRRQQLSLTAGLRFVDYLNGLDIRRKSDKLASLETLIVFAEENALSSYDSIYLQLAINESVAIATRDDKLKKAAKKLGIGFFE